MYDYIIIGSGIAGSILSNELPRNAKILVIECGNKKNNNFYQSFYRGNISKNSLNHGELDKYRNITLGGTSSTWGGAICSLDSSDFEKTDIDGYRYWPFDKQFLEKFYSKAAKYFGLENYKNNRVSGNNYSVFKNKETHLANFDTNILIRRYGKSINFSKYFINENVDIFLDSQVIDFIIENNRLKQIVTYNYALKKKQLFQGKKIILCNGGIESTRLVLASSLYKFITNKNIVGRFYSPHISMPVGIISKINNSASNLIYNYRSFSKQLSYKPFLYTNSDLIKNQRFLNSRFIFNPDLGNFYKYLNIFNSLNNNNLIKSIIPSNNLLVQLDSDQTPNYESKLFLSNKKNNDNLNSITIEHKILNNDFKKIEELIKNISLELYGKGWRLFNISNKYYPKYIYGMSHHMGTLRMSKNRKKGVVDENLKFFDFENLYLCSTSCFPTYGHANPSYTLGALACMIANNIANE